MARVQNINMHYNCHTTKTNNLTVTNDYTVYI